MSDSNPYTTPHAALEVEQGSENIEKVASGQKLIIYAILIAILAAVLQIAVHPAFVILSLATTVLSIIGLVKLSSGLGKSTGMIVVLAVLMIIPMVSIITLLVLNSQAIKVLKDSGYKVGLMGASKY